MNPLIQDFRRTLHQHPEVSGEEYGTSALVKDFLQRHYPGELLEDLGGAGFAMIYDFGPGGKTIMLRSELDALPIDEPNTMAWRSTSAGVSHKCGHDGHMAMVAGLVFWLREQRFTEGRVILLFQPAEETGAGAALVCADRYFQALCPDYVFALHNIPGVPMGTIIGLPDHFSAEVISCAITLTGKEAHAAEPENGSNPAFACAAIIAALDQLAVPDPGSDAFALLTPVHCRVGQVAYGIAPGRGELHYTIRTWSAERMQRLRSEVLAIVAEKCAARQLAFDIDWLAHFPSSKNDPTANALVASAARRAGLSWQQQAHPFKFGEDFGWFSREYSTAMFGLGAGVNTPALHHADYDFPDDLLPIGLKMFQALILQAMEV